MLAALQALGGATSSAAHELALKQVTSLKTSDLSELKSMSNPPASVRDVTAAMLLILGHKLAPDLSDAWEVAKRNLFNSTHLRDTLLAFLQAPQPVTPLEKVRTVLAGVDGNRVRMCSAAAYAFYCFSVAILPVDSEPAAAAPDPATDARIAQLQAIKVAFG